MAREKVPFDIMSRKRDPKARMTKRRKAIYRDMVSIPVKKQAMADKRLEALRDAEKKYEKAYERVKNTKNRRDFFHRTRMKMMLDRARDNIKRYEESMNGKGD